MPNSGTVPWIGGRMRRGVGPKVMRTLSCRISDRPNVATIDSAATLWMGWMTSRWISAPRMKPIKGAKMKASQKFPVDCSVAQASTVPTMKKSPCARLMMSSSPKMMARPRAIRAMISPQIRPFIAKSSSFSIGRRRSSDRMGHNKGRSALKKSQSANALMPVRKFATGCANLSACDNLEHRCRSGVQSRADQRRNRRRFHHVATEPQLLRGEAERQPHQLGEVQHRHVELLAEIRLDLLLKRIEHGVTEWARRHDRRRAVGARRLDVL